MKEVLEYLTKNNVVYFATCDEAGHPRVRPFQFMLEKDGKLWFCTSNDKKVYAELMHCKYLEMSVMDASGSWLRLWGRAEFVADRAMKEIILDHAPFVKSIYKSADNPVFEIFYVADAGASITDFSGNPPKEFKL